MIRRLLPPADMVPPRLVWRERRRRIPLIRVSRSIMISRTADIVTVAAAAGRGAVVVVPKPPGMAALAAHRALTLALVLSLLRVLPPLVSAVVRGRRIGEAGWANGLARMLALMRADTIDAEVIAVLALGIPRGIPRGSPRGIACAVCSRPLMVVAPVAVFGRCEIFACREGRVVGNISSPAFQPEFHSGIFL